MTRDELALYALTAFDLGDLVEIDDSEIIGEVAGFRIVLGAEDEYLVAYHDNCGNPQRQWWPASSLDGVDEPPRDSNVIPVPFPLHQFRSTTRH